MLVLGEGRFKARVITSTLRRKDGGLLHLSLQFEGRAWKDPATKEYQDIDGGYTIYEDFYLEKKDGTLNDAVIQRLAHVFGWQGDYLALEGSALNADCKITVGQEKYKDKLQFRVKWLNAYTDGDGEGTVSDPAIARAAQAALGAKTRAILASTPARPATATTAPSPSTLAQAIIAQEGATAESVFALFEARMQATGTPAMHLNDAWGAFLREEGKAQTMAEVGDWRPLAVAIANWTYLPFS